MQYQVKIATSFAIQTTAFATRIQADRAACRALEQRPEPKSVEVFEVAQ